MDDVGELLRAVAVLQLLADVLEVVDVELSLALEIEDPEVGLTAFLGEGASLNRTKGTSLAVSSLRNLSKSRAAP